MDLQTQQGFEIPNETQKIVKPRKYTPRKRKRKQIDKSDQEKLNHAISTWFRIMRKQHAIITGPIIKKHAQKIAKLMGFTTFKASNFWFWQWQKEENFDFKTLHEERNAAEQLVKYEQNKESLGSALRTCNKRNRECIFNDAEEQDNQDLNKDDVLGALGTLRKYFGASDFSLKSLEDIFAHLKGTPLKSGIKNRRHFNGNIEVSSAACSMAGNQSRDVKQEITWEYDDIPPEETFDTISNLKDQYSVYGESIAYRLYDCENDTDSYEINIAQQNVDDVLLKLSMGHYSRACN